MHLIAHDIVRIANMLVATYCNTHGVNLADLYDVEENKARMSDEELLDYSLALDFGSAGWIANQTQTFLFDTDQVLQFLRAIDRKLPPGAYHAPFRFMCLQFSQGIDEKIFTTGLRSSGSVEESDEILGLLIALPDQEESPTFRFVNVVAWYKSTSINRIQIPIHGDGSIEYRELLARPGVDTSTLQADKQRIANLAFLCLAYMTTPGMEIERIAADARANRKREAKGKRALPDYYVCRWNGNRDRVASSAGGEHGQGTAHSFRYDVSGHYRKLPDGRLIWIHPHQRGIDNSRYVPKVYRVA